MVLKLFDELGTDKTIETLESIKENDFIMKTWKSKYLKEEIEYELNKDKIRKSTIDRYSVELSDATESVQSNPVLVSADS